MRRLRAIVLGGLGFLVILGILLFLARGPLIRAFMSPGAPPAGQAGASVDDLPAGALRTVVEGLEAPWEIAFLPDGGMLITERPGRLVLLPPSVIGPNDRPLRPEDAESWTIPNVEAAGESGLMGLALHPGWASNGWIYVMLTAVGAEGGGLENRVERYRLSADGPVERTVMVEGMPGGLFHDGGRLAFGSDGMLYVTIGETGETELAQDSGSLGGKILRVTDSGAPAPGNPFGSRIWSLGHRNPQGLTWDPDGVLWSTEHGRSGLGTGMDELNRIEPGANYGWPLVEGDSVAPGTVGPVLHSGPDYTWAPSAVAWLDGRLYFGGLRGEALYQVTIEGGRASGIVAHFATELGRIRAVVVGPDGALYLATSNRDGRGRAREGDDRIVRVEVGALGR